METGGVTDLSETIEALSVLSDRAEALLHNLVADLDGVVDRSGSALSDSAAGLLAPEVVRELTVAAARLRQSTSGIGILVASSVEQTRVDRVDAARTPRKWLARHAGLSHRDASVAFRSAAAMAHYPLIGQAFLDGRITDGHLHATAGIIPARFRGPEAERLIEMVRDIQSTLIEAAETSTVDEFEALCGRVRDRLDSDGPEDRTNEPSRIRLTRLFDGRWSLSGDLSAVDGAVMASMLADQIAAMKPTVSPADTEQSETEQSDTEPVLAPEPELRAEAMMKLLQAGAGTTKPGHVSLFVHIDLEDLITDTPALTDLVSRSGNAHTEAGIDIDTDSLWGLLAGADVTAVFNMSGTPLSFGRSARLAPPVLRRILAHRDRRCRFPGCDHPPNRCEVHHLEHWEDGGSTDPKNCVHLSKSHHHDHHDRGWSITGDANEGLEVRRPSGELFDAAPAYRKRLRDEAEADRNLIRSRLLAAK